MVVPPARVVRCERSTSLPAPLAWIVVTEADWPA